MDPPDPFERRPGRGDRPPPWPVHPAPLEDELLTSWLTRLAHANHQDTHTFAAVTWPGRRIFVTDLDRRADREVLEALASRACVTMERVRATTLAAYAGRLYGTFVADQRTKWVLSASRQAPHRHGLQFCPACLDASPPYFRRRWRVAFMTACEVHDRPLRIACPRCRAPVRLWARPPGPRRPECPHVCRTCGHDLRRSEDQADAGERPWLPAALPFQKRLLAALEQGWTAVEPNDKPIYSHLFFDVVHQLVCLLNAGNQTRGLAVAAREGLGLAPTPTSFRPGIAFERLAGGQRGELLAMAGWLLEGWPERFVEICRRQRIHATALLKGMDQPPFWYWSVIAERLRVLHAPWRTSAGAKRVQSSYNRIVRRWTGKRLVEQEQRILFVRAHPDLWEQPKTLAKALKAGGLYGPQTPYRDVLKRCPELIALARDPDDWWRCENAPEPCRARALRERLSYRRFARRYPPSNPSAPQERRINFVRAHPELWRPRRLLAKALKAAGLYSPNTCDAAIQRQCRKFIARAREPNEP